MGGRDERVGIRALPVRDQTSLHSVVAHPNSFPVGESGFFSPE